MAAVLALVFAGALVAVAREPGGARVAQAECADPGFVTDYNTFVLGDHRVINDSVDGRMAVGGDAIVAADERWPEARADASRLSTSWSGGNIESGGNARANNGAVTYGDTLTGAFSAYGSITQRRAGVRLRADVHPAAFRPAVVGNPGGERQGHPSRVLLHPDQLHGHRRQAQRLPGQGGGPPGFAGDRDQGARRRDHADQRHRDAATRAASGRRPRCASGTATSTCSSGDDAPNDRVGTRSQGSAVELPGRRQHPARSEPGLAGQRAGAAVVRAARRQHALPRHAHRAVARAAGNRDVAGLRRLPAAAVPAGPDADARRRPKRRRSSRHPRRR